MAGNDHIGSVSLPLSALADKRPRRAWFELGLADEPDGAAPPRGDVELWVRWAYDDAHLFLATFGGMPTANAEG